MHKQKITRINPLSLAIKRIESIFLKWQSPQFLQSSPNIFSLDKRRSRLEIKLFPSLPISTPRDDGLWLIRDQPRRVIRRSANYLYSSSNSDDVPLSVLPPRSILLLFATSDGTKYIESRLTRQDSNLSIFSNKFEFWIDQENPVRGKW